MQKTLLALCIVAATTLVGCNEDTVYVDVPVVTDPNPIVLPEPIAGPEKIMTPRNVVYLSLGRYESTLMQNVEARGAEITDYFISFINPSATITGEVQPMSEAQKRDFDKLMTYANKENPNARIYLAIGGWRGQDSGFDLEFEEIARDPVKRELFINSMMNLVEMYDADGIDIDWEYPRVDTEDRKFAQEYALFVREIANELHLKGKLLSSAILGVQDKVTDDGNADAYLDSTLVDFDSLNLMAYDMDFENHSTYQHAADAINYWVNERGYDAQRTILGLPAYSRNNWKDWNYLTLQHPSQQSAVMSGEWPINDLGEVVSPEGYSVVNACRNTFEFTPNLSEPNKVFTNYYNGIPLIIKKAQLAMIEGLGGVMFWEAPLDAAKQEFSLIHATHVTMNNLAIDNVCTQNPTWIVNDHTVDNGKLPTVE
ncbi:glycoside hydrolase family 18 protein [Photobacterium carnosum]|uniref:glycoside hydrolase family 18 protein n=1 Tax=Photobacterium carnosum TaxID=2023717 RepID=UPI001E560D91|nr:glycoside hydrolase family 18 protein [Photobacterium carnosum]